jgi:hypothetical protein
MRDTKLLVRDADDERGPTQKRRRKPAKMSLRETQTMRCAKRLRPEEIANNNDKCKKEAHPFSCSGAH